MSIQRHIVPVITDPKANVTGSAYWGFTGVSGTEANVQMVTPKGRITRLDLNIGVNTATSLDVTLRVNGANSTLTGNLTGTGHKTIAGAVDVADGDLISIYIVKNGAGGSVYRPTNGELRYGNA